MRCPYEANIDRRDIATKTSAFPIEGTCRNRNRLVAIAQQTRHDGCHAARDGIGEPPPRIKPFDSGGQPLRTNGLTILYILSGSMASAAPMTLGKMPEPQVTGSGKAFPLSSRPGGPDKGRTSSPQVEVPPIVTPPVNGCIVSSEGGTVNDEQVLQHLCTCPFFLKKHREFLFNNRGKILKVASRKNQTEKQGAQHEPVDGADLSACLPA